MVQISWQKEASKEEGNATMVSDGYDFVEVLTITTKNTEKEWVLSNKNLFM